MNTQSRTCKILSRLAKDEWKNIGNSSEPPELSPDTLRNWMPPLTNDDLLRIFSFTDVHSPLKMRLSKIPKESEPNDWQIQSFYRMMRCEIQHTIDVPTQIDYVENTVDYSKNSNLEAGTLINIEDPFKITNIDEIKPRIVAHYAMLAILSGWHSKDQLKIIIQKNDTHTSENGKVIINLDTDSIQDNSFWIIHSIRSLEDGVLAIQDLWKIVNKKHKDEFFHPLIPIVRAYLQETTAQNISKEYDSKHPVAVIKNPLGSIQVQFNGTETARLREFTTPKSIKQVQTELSESTSVLPNVLPLDIATPLGVEFKTRPGAVSHVLRIFFEALMALEPNQTQGNISFSLGDLISYLYPHGKFNRTNQLPYIINALDILHFYATVPFQQTNGNMGRWRPVVVRNVLDRTSKNNDLIFLDVRMPPDAKQGMLVEKQVMRMLGKKCAPHFSAYLSACAIWDKYGTANGKLIDPTRPIVNRNCEGYLVDQHGNELHSSNGKRIKNPYQSDAIHQLEREPNPSRTKYPILSSDDLIKACNLTNTKNIRLALKRAKDYWTKLESGNIVRIERLPQGWRIMPSEKHMQAYRAMLKAIGNSTKQSQA